MDRLDIYDKFPRCMKHYFGIYGWHFSKKMYEWATDNMWDKHQNKVPTITNDKLKELLNKYNLKVDYVGYDGPYVYSMAIADFYTNSLRTEEDIMRYIYDLLNDPDGYEEIVFTRFYADCIGKGIPIIWEDMI